MTVVAFLTSFTLIFLVATSNGPRKPAIGLLVRDQLVTAATNPEPVALPDELPTWLPERGVRGLFNQVGGNLSLATFQKLVKGPLFLEGPHDGGAINCESEAEFGRYNPVAVAKLAKICRELTGDASFVAATQESYDSHVKRLVQTYYEAALVCQANPQWMETAREEYLKRVRMRLAGGFEFGLDRQFSDFAERSLGLDWYEANTAVGFWLRRSIDQSEAHFFSGVESLLQAYDPNYLKERKQKPVFEFKGHEFRNGE
tara:strand:- start:8172 stop:8945 length:774 start_codon:yes stop_codon:yes gene_type:complete